jgi:hypothetical protein
MSARNKHHQVTIGAKASPELGLAVDRAISESSRTSMTTRSDFVRVAIQRYLRDLGYGEDDRDDSQQEKPKGHFWAKHKQ